MYASDYSDIIKHRLRNNLAKLEGYQETAGGGMVRHCVKKYKKGPRKNKCKKMAPNVGMGMVGGKKRGRPRKYAANLRYGKCKPKTKGCQPTGLKRYLEILEEVRSKHPNLTIAKARAMASNQYHGK